MPSCENVSVRLYLSSTRKIERLKNWKKDLSKLYKKYLSNHRHWPPCCAQLLPVLHLVYEAEQILYILFHDSSIFFRRGSCHKFLFVTLASAMLTGDRTIKDNIADCNKKTIVISWLEWISTLGVIVPSSPLEQYSFITKFKVRWFVILYVVVPFYYWYYMYCSCFCNFL